MLNLKNFAIDMNEIEIKVNQMKNATSVVLKAALSSCAIIADQVLLQSKESKKLHVKSDGLELIVGDGRNMMVIIKEATFVAGIDTIANMDYELVNISYHQMTELLNSLIKLG